MNKYLLLLLPFLFTACVNRHGVSLKYYSECKEYYDLQGYYHKKCGEDDIVTYKGVAEGTKNAYDSTLNFITGTEEEPKGNVW